MLLSQLFLGAQCKGAEMHLFLQAGHKNPPGEREPVGAVSAGGLVKAGKPHVNVCPGLLAAATAGLSHSGPDP